MLVLGAKSAVGSTYNHLTPLFHKLIDAFNAGEIEKASSIQKEVMIFVKTLSRHGFHSSSKFVLNLLGLDLGPVRLPLRNLSESEKETLTQDISHSGLLEKIKKPST